MKSIQNLSHSSITESVIGSMCKVLERGSNEEKGVARLFLIISSVIFTEHKTFAMIVAKPIWIYVRRSLAEIFIVELRRNFALSVMSLLSSKLATHYLTFDGFGINLFYDQS